MATPTQNIPDNPTQPVSARYGRILTGIQFPSRPVRRSERSHGTGPCLTTPTGKPLSCQRHNGQWYNYVLPAETSHLLLEMDMTRDADRTVTELVLFIGGQEQALPLPSQPPLQEETEAHAVSLRIDLPAIPHWIPALLCIRLIQREQKHIEQAA